MPYTKHLKHNLECSISFQIKNELNNYLILQHVEYVEYFHCNKTHLINQNQDTHEYHEDIVP